MTRSVNRPDAGPADPDAAGQAAGPDDGQAAGAAFSAAETAAMELALRLAGRGVRGANPLVGAVILDESGAVLSSGHHRGAGTAHAEADAIANLPAGTGSLAGATIVVTLEPCNHQGRTGPCSQAILDAGIGSLVYAVGDKTAAAAGGASFLRSRGVRVRQGLLAGAARELNHRWFRAQASRRPFITLHLAQTVDGFIAAADGTSQWITGSEARADSHSIRARADAILAGTGTILADNPRLTARDASGTETPRQPLRVVLGRSDLPAGAAVIGDGNYVHYKTRDAGAAVAELGLRRVSHLMVEGGATVAAAFLAADLVDEIVLYLAPAFLGAGTRSMAGLGIGTLADASRWRWDAAGPGAVVLGADLRLQLEPLPAPDRSAGRSPVTTTELSPDTSTARLPGKGR